MIAADALLDAFINANILFLIGYVFWLLVRKAMHWFGLKHAFAIQLRLLNTVFLAIVAAPLLALAYRTLQNAGVARDVNLNLSDAIVAYYLNGGIQMDSSRFEAMVLMRDDFVFNVLTANGIVAKTVIAIFLAGLVLGLLRLITSVLRLRNIVAKSHVWRRAGRIELRISDRTLVPFSTRGLRKYYVVIPSHMLGSGDQIKIALAHEFQHIRQGDLEWEVVLEALKPVFFLNPVYRTWKRQVEHLRELNCDCQVLSAGRIDVRSYCETLLSVCQKTLRRDRTFLLAVPKVTLVTAERQSLDGAKHSLIETRILSVLEMRALGHQRLIFAAIAIPLLVATTFATLTIQSPGDWSHDRLMLSTVVNLDRLDEINRLSTFGQSR